MNIRRKRGIIVVLTLCLAFSLMVLAPTRAGAEQSIDRILCSLNFEPVVMMELQYVKVSSSSTGCHITQAYWTDSAGVPVTTQFGKGDYTLVVGYQCDAGYLFSPTAVGYVNNNNSGVSAAISADGSTATLRKTYSATIWAPTSLKNPESATADYGGWASFAVSSIYAESHEWHMEDPSGNQYTVPKAADKLPGLTYTGEKTERLNLHNIPAELDGWKVYCTHWSVDHLTSANSAKATIKVVNIPEPVIEPTPTPVPLTVPTPQPEPEAETMPEEPSPAEDPNAPVLPEEPQPAEHVHSYSGWASDESSHWRVCDECGEATAREAHRFVWHETRAATQDMPGEETGVCSFCGYTQRRMLAYEGSTGVRLLDLNDSGTVIYILGALGLILLLLIVSAIISGSRNRRRRRRRR